MKLISLCIFLFSSLGLATLGINLNSDSNTHEVPKAFKENYLSDNFSKGRYGNRPIIDQLYVEAMEQDIALKSLHSDLVTISAHKHTNLEDFNSYRTNNLNYIGEFSNAVNRIENPELKSIARDLLKSFEDQYASQMTALIESNNTIESIEDEVNDLHVLLKLTTSIKVMDDYQSKKFPDIEQIDDVIIRYETLAKHLKQHMEVIPES